MRRKVLLTIWAAVAAAVLATPLAAKGNFPEKIALPDGFRPEGIAIDKGGTFYVGSIGQPPPGTLGGAIYRGELKTGEGEVIVPPAAGRSAIGVELSHDRLFVAGGGTGKGFVYSVKTRQLLMEAQLATLPIDMGANATFINDVVVARGGAYFTDSRRPFLYRLGRDGSVTRIPLTGDIVHVPGVNNANGIETTSNRKRLIIVQSNTPVGNNVSKLFTVNRRTGETDEIVLNRPIMNGDGLHLDGRTLYVVQNRSNSVAVIRLNRKLTEGTVTTEITDSDFDVPTTIDEFGKRLYAVNARFTTPPTADTDYWVAQFRKAKK
jgi:sugar lactone lactonase YvrE